MAKEQILPPETDANAGDNMLPVDQSTVALLSKAEIDQQIATAHAYPRSLAKFQREAVEMVTSSVEFAQECMYVLPRGGKKIKGPSVRFAEVIQSAWGNSRAGARVIHEGDEFVTAQGAYHDLERNVAVTYETQRRITDKDGKRFGVDMIGVTANAACAIAMRNAILKGIPKAFWNEMYVAVQRTIAGDIATLPERREKALQAFKELKVSKEQIIEMLQVKGVVDIGVDELIVLGGVLTAIGDGDTTVEEVFGETKKKAASPPSAPRGKAADKKVDTKADKKTTNTKKTKPKQEAAKSDEGTSKETTGSEPSDSEQKGTSDGSQQASDAATEEDTSQESSAPATSEEENVSEAEQAAISNAEDVLIHFRDSLAAIPNGDLQTLEDYQESFSGMRDRLPESVVEELENLFTKEEMRINPPDA